jgi:hypothetical protein
MFDGSTAVERFLEDFDGWLSERVTVYLLGGSAMTIRGLKDRTEDIDLALGVTDEFEHVRRSLRERGFRVTAEPTAAFESVGQTLELTHPDRGTQIDLFDRQVVGKVRLTEQMRTRADEFWSGERANAEILADEDMFLLKAVAGGDVGAARRRDIEDMQVFAQRGLDYDTIVAEIERQRPFNEGTTEARQIRDRSHPLFAVESAVLRLPGLPSSFTDRVTELATEFEVESVLLDAVDGGTHDVSILEEQTQADVRSLSDDDGETVERGLDRLVQKGILRRDGQSVRLV